MRVTPRPEKPGSSRERIIDLLRRSEHTVEELAEQLGVTDNAVRLQLSILERDGVVCVSGIRRDGNVGKPATLYGIAPAAQPSFSRAYVPFLSTLLATLGDRFSARQLRAIMRDVGRRLAGAQPPSRDQGLMARAEMASAVLNELGGVTTVHRRDGVAVIEGCGCPLSAAVAQREEVCVAVQTMLHDITGAEVQECCDRANGASCRFTLSLKA
jgi:predicted ArsR family transcriptional regulator